MNFQEQVLVAIRQCNPDDQIAILEAICIYAFDNCEVILEGQNNAIWMLAKHSIDKAKEEFTGKKKRRSAFIKPEVEEIIHYVQQKHPCAEMSKVETFAHQFYSFYESKGWMVGKVPMKNWQAALVTWKDTMLKVIYAKGHLFQSPAKGSWEYRQNEYLKGMQSILNDENI